MKSGFRPYSLETGDVTPDEGWRLLRWCHAHGATEFTLHLLDDPHTETAFALLNPLWRGRAERDHICGGPTREVDLFELSDSGLAALQTLLPFGLFSWWFEHLDTAQWVEDPVVYRGGELLLAVISHEGFAELRVPEEERAELSATGLRLHSVP
jgi:hypothetical protein